jgi:hypothetical protein
MCIHPPTQKHQKFFSKFRGRDPDIKYMLEQKNLVPADVQA